MDVEVSAARAPGRCFRGSRGSPSSVSLVVVADAATGEVLGPLVHRVRYSPTGLNWGYDGAGPRDLARSLLAAVLEDQAQCSSCRGAGGCTACVDGLRRDLPDAELVRDIVSYLGPQWLLHEDQIRAWWNETGKPDE